MKHFKVNLGYNLAVSIDETELEKVSRAQEAGGIVYVKEGMINTKYISSILPDYNRDIGWNANYVPNESKDFQEMAEIREEYTLIQEKLQNKLKGGDERKQLN